MSNKYRLQYCVARVSVYMTGPEVAYYAYQKGPYGLHLASDINDECVLWYDTAAEARKHLRNENECIISMRREG